MPYKYRLTITTDSNITQKLVDNKQSVCDILNITMSTLTNILVGRIKNKYNYIKIERIVIPSKKNKEEYAKVIRKETAKKYEFNRKIKKLEKLKMEEEEYKNKIISNLENITDAKIL